MRSCSTSADHPPAIAHVRVFTHLANDAGQGLDNLCGPCTRSALETNARVLTSGGIASIVVLSLDALNRTNEPTGPEVTHDFSPSHTGRVCDAMVMRDGDGDQCGLPAEAHA